MVYFVQTLMITITISWDNPIIKWNLFFFFLIFNLKKKLNNKIGEKGRKNPANTKHTRGNSRDDWEREEYRWLWIDVKEWRGEGPLALVYVRMAACKGEKGVYRVIWIIELEKDLDSSRVGVMSNKTYVRCGVCYLYTINIYYI